MDSASSGCDEGYSTDIGVEGNACDMEISPDDGSIGFYCRHSTTQKGRDGVVALKHVVCSREGFKQSYSSTSSSTQSSIVKRRRVTNRVGCKAKHWGGGVSTCGCGGCGTLDCGMDGHSSSGGAFSNCKALSTCPYPKPPDLSSYCSLFKSSLNVQDLKAGKLLGTLRLLYEVLHHYLIQRCHPHHLVLRHHLVPGCELPLPGHVGLLQPILGGVVVFVERILLLFAFGLSIQKNVRDKKKRKAEGSSNPSDKKTRVDHVEPAKSYPREEGDRPWKNQSTQQQGATTGNKTSEKHCYCNGCGKNHPGMDCQGNVVECFKCGKKGHRAFACRAGKGGTFQGVKQANA
nr:protein FAR1-RELATED SEQUENCE 5-like [Ipomoea batatas]